MQHVDITIIGAGVVGLAIAAEASRPGRAVCVIERHDGFGQETSSRNSEVIHAGIYYPQNTLKAAGCVEGNRLLYEFCAKNGIAHRRITKVVVARGESETATLEKLYRNGAANGVELRLIGRDELKRLEPEVAGVAAIFSPNTGIVDSHGLMKYYESAARSRDAQVVYGAAVSALEKTADGIVVTVDDTDGQKTRLRSRVVVNAAGLESDRVAAMAGIDVRAAGYELKPCKGVYFKVGGGKEKKISRLVYPVPDHAHGVLGTHACLDLAGALKLGPDAEYVSRDGMSYAVDARKRDAFFASVRGLLPFIDAGDLSPDMSGIRPKLHGPEEKFRDFVITHEDAKGLYGMINLIGIESPGLTASPWIGRYVARMAERILKE
ncbi:MAG TPA: NAD(P)/FAD-dependent oxidoreductase [bacterium]|nr:NAD(P)/FAD-dependent oxidoreductase [bacterium]